MNYEMKVKITDPHTPEGMTSELFFDLTCTFAYNEKQYGNGHYLVIKGKGFEPKHFDLRYDMSLIREGKEKWLEKWARSWWSGKNGAWTIKSLEITKI